VSRVGICALSKLSSLEEFIFYEPDRSSQQVPQMRLCLQLLPQLQVAGGCSDPMRCQLQLLGLLTGRALSGLTGPHTLQLRRLELTSLTDVPQNVHLPQLQLLYLSKPGASIQSDIGVRFPKMSELGLFAISDFELLRILGHVGRRLQKLRLSSGSTVDVDRVLEVCPNLSELDVHVYGVHAADRVRSDTVRRLRTLRLSFGDASRVGNQFT